MKTKSISLFLTVILIGAFHLTIQAQKTSRSMVLTNNQEVNTAPDNAITGTILLPEKLLRNFNTNFPSAVNIKWTSTPDAFFASFMSGERAFSATFSKKGQFVYALIYGNAKDLPVSVQEGIRKTYPSFTIHKVVEMITPGTVDYQVILQNATQYIDLKISAQGHMEESKKITKAEG